ncbi:MAG: ribosome-binding factor A, partial [Xanthomonadaceae bacterium]|nr:ribosome-binding factor A [Xanthomonadaceae bacterium]
QPERSAEVVKALKALAKEFRYQLAHTMRMRRVPELRFKYDASVDTGERIERLLREDRESGHGTGDPEER